MATCIRCMCVGMEEKASEFLHGAAGLSKMSRQRSFRLRYGTPPNPMCGRKRPSSPTSRPCSSTNAISEWARTQKRWVPIPSSVRTYCRVLSRTATTAYRSWLFRSIPTTEVSDIMLVRSLLPAAVLELPKS